MKALTLTQPWATLVALGAKKIETRSWNTNYRGPLAIHAAKGFPDEAYMMCHQEVFAKALVEKADILHPDGLPRGKIIAICNLVDVAKISEIQSFSSCKGHWQNKHMFDLNETERAFGDYSVGRYMWLLEDVKPLEVPVTAKGALGLWKWNEGEA